MKRGCLVGNGHGIGFGVLWQLIAEGDGIVVTAEYDLETTELEVLEGEAAFIEPILGMVRFAEQNRNALVHGATVLADDAYTCKKFAVIRGLKPKKAISQERRAIERCGPARALVRASSGYLNGDLEAVVGRREEAGLLGFQKWTESNRG